eukprot:TRINITY_DN361_c0_g1_i1.p1 TRINITY_DN361_c0_g1~~TRINITY_DN361_c0_g1_i1.p1  ORF type:complete len:2570 (-),score=249.85 TRINITY_DN361_c0_g1_i1:418-8127(-)
MEVESATVLVGFGFALALLCCLILGASLLCCLFRARLRTILRNAAPFVGGSLSVPTGPRANQRAYRDGSRPLQVTVHRSVSPESLSPAGPCRTTTNGETSLLRPEGDRTCAEGVGVSLLPTVPRPDGQGDPSPRLGGGIECPDTLASLATKSEREPEKNGRPLLLRPDHVQIPPSEVSADAPPSCASSLAPRPADQKPSYASSTRRLLSSDTSVRPLRRDAISRSASGGGAPEVQQRTGADDDGNSSEVVRVAMASGSLTADPTAVGGMYQLSMVQREELHDRDRASLDASSRVGARDPAVSAGPCTAEGSSVIRSPGGTPDPVVSLDGHASDCPLGRLHIQSKSQVGESSSRRQRPPRLPMGPYILPDGTRTRGVTTMMALDRATSRSTRRSSPSMIRAAPCEAGVGSVETRALSCGLDLRRTGTTRCSVASGSGSGGRSCPTKRNNGGAQQSHWTRSSVVNTQSSSEQSQKLRPPGVSPVTMGSACAPSHMGSNSNSTSNNYPSTVLPGTSAAGSPGYTGKTFANGRGETGANGSKVHHREGASGVRARERSAAAVSHAKRPNEASARARHGSLKLSTERVKPRVPPTLQKPLACDGQRLSGPLVSVAMLPGSSDRVPDSTGQPSAQTGSSRSTSFVPSLGNAGSMRPTFALKAANAVPQRSVAPGLGHASGLSGDSQHHAHAVRGMGRAATDAQLPAVQGTGLKRAEERGHAAQRSRPAREAAVGMHMSPHNGSGKTSTSPPASAPVGSSDGASGGGWCRGGPESASTTSNTRKLSVTGMQAVQRASGRRVLAEWLRSGPAAGEFAAASDRGSGSTALASDLRSPLDPPMSDSAARTEDTRVISQRAVEDNTSQPVEDSASHPLDSLGVATREGMPAGATSESVCWSGDWPGECLASAAPVLPAVDLPPASAALFDPVPSRRSGRMGGRAPSGAVSSSTVSGGRNPGVGAAASASARPGTQTPSQTSADQNRSEEGRTGVSPKGSSVTRTSELDHEGACESVPPATSPDVVTTRVGSGSSTRSPARFSRHLSEPKPQHGKSEDASDICRRASASSAAGSTIVHMLTSRPAAARKPAGMATAVRKGMPTDAHGMHPRGDARSDPPSGSDKASLPEKETSPSEIRSCSGSGIGSGSGRRPTPDGADGTSSREEVVREEVTEVDTDINTEGARVIDEDSVARAAATGSGAQTVREKLADAGVQETAAGAEVGMMPEEAYAAACAVLARSRANISTSGPSAQSSRSPVTRNSRTHGFGQVGRSVPRSLGPAIPSDEMESGVLSYTSRSSFGEATGSTTTAPLIGAPPPIAPSALEVSRPVGGVVVARWAGTTMPSDPVSTALPTAAVVAETPVTSKSSASELVDCASTSFSASSPRARGAFVRMPAMATPGRAFRDTLEALIPSAGNSPDAASAGATLLPTTDLPTRPSTDTGGHAWAGPLVPRPMDRTVPPPIRDGVPMSLMALGVISSGDRAAVGSSPESEPLSAVKTTMGSSALALAAPRGRSPLRPSWARRSESGSTRPGAAVQLVASTGTWRQRPMSGSSRGVATADAEMKSNEGLSTTKRDGATDKSNRALPTALGTLAFSRAGRPSVVDSIAASASDMRAILPSPHARASLAGGPFVANAKSSQRGLQTASSAGVPPPVLVRIPSPQSTKLMRPPELDFGFMTGASAPEVSPCCGVSAVSAVSGPPTATQGQGMDSLHTFQECLPTAIPTSAVAEVDQTPTAEPTEEGVAAAGAAGLHRKRSEEDVSAPVPHDVTKHVDIPVPSVGPEAPAESTGGSSALSTGGSSALSAHPVYSAGVCEADATAAESAVDRTLGLMARGLSDDGLGSPLGDLRDAEGDDEDMFDEEDASDDYDDVGAEETDDVIAVDWSSPIGMGTSGVVYKGVDRRTDRAVACKVISGGLTAEARRELKSALRLPPHANIASLVSVFVGGAPVYDAVDLLHNVGVVPDVGRLTPTDDLAASADEKGGALVDGIRDPAPMGMSEYLPRSVAEERPATTATAVPRESRTPPMFMAGHHTTLGEPSAESVLSGESLAGGRKASREMDRLVDELFVSMRTEAGSAAAQVVIVTEWMSRGTLADAAESDVVPQADLARFCAQAVAGVAHLHAHRVLHRDIKPQNIFIDGGGTAKVGDFGLALSSVSAACLKRRRVTSRRHPQRALTVAAADCGSAGNTGGLGNVPLTASGSVPMRALCSRRRLSHFVGKHACAQIGGKAPASAAASTTPRHPTEGASLELHVSGDGPRTAVVRSTSHTSELGVAQGAMNHQVTKGTEGAPGGHMHPSLSVPNGAFAQALNCASVSAMSARAASFEMMDSQSTVSTMSYLPWGRSRPAVPLFVPPPAADAAAEAHGVLGTAAYLPPEVFCDPVCFLSHGDVWALGVTTAAVLLRCRAVAVFDVPDPERLVFRLMATMPASVRTANAKLAQRIRSRGHRALGQRSTADVAVRGHPSVAVAAAVRTAKPAVISGPSECRGTHDSEGSALGRTTRGTTDLAGQGASKTGDIQWSVPGPEDSPVPAETRARLRAISPDADAFVAMCTLWNPLKRPPAAMLLEHPFVSAVFR